MRKRSKERARWLSRYGCCYMPFKPPGVWYEKGCVYCGNAADSKDHIPPISWVAALGPQYFEENGIMLVWVPSCRECNSTLTDKKLFTIKERTVYILNRYLKKYKAFLVGETWKEWEVDELTGRTKQAIGNFAEYQRGIDRRIAILEENISVRSVRETV